MLSYRRYLFLKKIRFIYWTKLKSLPSFHHLLHSPQEFWELEQVPDFHLASDFDHHYQERDDHFLFLKMNKDNKHENVSFNLSPENNLTWPKKSPNNNKNRVREENLNQFMIIVLDILIIQPCNHKYSQEKNNILKIVNNLHRTIEKKIEVKFERTNRKSCQRKDHRAI